MRKIVDVSTEHHGSYPVFAGHDLPSFFRRCWRTGWAQAVLIGDDNTAGRFAEPVCLALAPCAPSVLRLSFPPGEHHKSRETKARLEDAMLHAGIERGACVIGLGGGIALDMAGFVAATFLRGIPVIHIATSLLAQVDASVGGKTAVNTPHGKNLIGAFHPPHAVLLATEWLSSLPVAELANGLAEAVKTAAVADASLFEELEAFAQRGHHAAGVPPASCIEQCVRIKARIVGLDEHEGGLRRILNFGHTVGHAIELASGHQIPHGRAVALGMLVEARAAESLVALPPGDRARLDSLVARLQLSSVEAPAFESIAPVLASDKKTRDGRVRCALPLAIGAMDDAGGDYAREVPIDLLAAAWRDTLAAQRLPVSGEERS